MRPTAQRFAEQWLAERVIARGIVSAKDVADRVVADGKAHGIAAEDFDDDKGRLFAMILASIDRGAS
jgi:hypothetical protein